MGDTKEHILKDQITPAIPVEDIPVEEFLTDLLDKYKRLPQRTNKVRLDTLSKLLEHEQYILDNISDTSRSLLHTILANADPYDPSVYENYITRNKSEIVMGIVPFTTSPLLDAINDDAVKQNVIKGIMMHFVFVCKNTCKRKKGVYPSNFDLARIIMDSQYLVDILLESVPDIQWNFMHVLVPLLKYDTTLCSRLPVSFVKYYKSHLHLFKDKTAKKHIEDYLISRNIDISLFWDTVDSTPDLSIYALIELLARD